MADSLSETQKEDFKQVFNMFDKDGNGKITASELGTVMKALGQFPTETELEDMINDADIDGSGTVNFNEFLVMMSKTTSPEDSDNELREAFKLFDKNGDGYINAEELRAAVESLEETVTDQDIQDMIDEADENKDNVISYPEFVKMMMNKK